MHWIKNNHLKSEFILVLINIIFSSVSVVSSSNAKIFDDEKVFEPSQNSVRTISFLLDQNNYFHHDYVEPKNYTPKKNTKVLFSHPKTQIHRERADSFNTSCKKISCDYVEDYPKSSIEKAFLKQVLKPISHMFNYASTLSSSLSRHFLLKDNAKIPVKVQSDGSCEKTTKISDLREAVDLNNEPKIVVNYKEVYSPKSVECSAPKYCVDNKTPEDHIHHCKNKVIDDYVYTFDKFRNKIQISKVKRAAGCDCVKLHKDKIELY